MAAMLQLRNMDLDKKARDKKQTWQFFRELGLIDGSELKARNYKGVNGAWQDQPCYVIGASPSLRKTLKAVGGWKFFNGKHTIGINHMIEDYDGFEWHLFLDKRFLSITTYDYKNYKGITFANCTTGMKPGPRQRIFYTRNDGPSLRIEDGLYGSLSGISAVNLAIISGANPIYLFGLEPGLMPVTNDNLHWKKGYTGEKPRERVAEKYERIMRWFDIFKNYSARLRLVTDGGKWFPWMRRVDASSIAVTEHDKKVYVVPRSAKIVHLSFSADVERHADITRYIVKECVGSHQIIDIRTTPVPDADLYIAEHFLSTNEKINGLTNQHKKKCIDVVHTVNCIPHGKFKRVVALTNAWKRWLEAHLVQVTDVLIPGIDLEPYKNITPNYSGKVFGRMTRWRPGKIPPGWNDLTHVVLDEVPGSRCIIYTEKNEDPQRPFSTDTRVIYDHNCKINDFKGDFLKRLSVYVHANGSFKETLSFAVIEAMATGLPIVYLSEGTGVLEEVTGNSGIRCETLGEVKTALIDLLSDEAKRREYGAKAKAQSIIFGKQHMVAEWNEVIEQCLKS